MASIHIARLPSRLASHINPLPRRLPHLHLRTITSAPLSSLGASSTPLPHETLPETPPVVIPEAGRRPAPSLESLGLAGKALGKGKEAAPGRKSRIRSTRSAITMTPTAVSRLRDLLLSPTPTHLRIGVRQKGCAGMSYHLEYVAQPGPFDEVVEQDGVRVLIDSKALFSIIGSEMDWKDDLLSSKFVFKNPNIKDACGCGESFNVGQSISL